MMDMKLKRPQEITALSNVDPTYPELERKTMNMMAAPKFENEDASIHIFGDQSVRNYGS